MPPKRTSKPKNPATPNSPSDPPPLPLKLRLRITRLQAKRRNFVARRDLFLSRSLAAITYFSAMGERCGVPPVLGKMKGSFIDSCPKGNFDTTLTADNIYSEEISVKLGEAWLEKARKSFVPIELAMDASNSGNKKRFLEAFQDLDKTAIPGLSLFTDELMADWERRVKEAGIFVEG
ncbi:hypothetical protein BJ508DRAFT_312043 [Ascobolus immersus RN42]|uniref:Uncharacterized protein n=1 Tax=Ascobolus immersus RN42 TaxID=1160509 RepID=A0A3N4HNF9_ASCIM|nr:hypothetical protein BJ508DRAFT_312043 [Ascobolus immersus RN42]